MVFAFTLIHQRLIVKHLENFLDGVSTIDDVCIAVGKTRGGAGQAFAIEDKRGELSCCEFRRTWDHHLSSVEKDQHHSEVGQKLTTRVVHGREVDLFLVDFVALGDGLSISLSLHFFSAVGFYHLNAWKFLGNKSSDLGLNILILPHQHFVPFAIEHGDYQIERDDK